MAPDGENTETPSSTPAVLRKRASRRAVIGGGVAAAFRLIHWHTLFEILGGLAIAFAAANIVSTVYG